MSNVNKFDLKYDKEHFKIFELIDGAIYSAENGMLNTEKECYKILLDKYKLNPAECIFIDDSLPNIEVSTKFFGIKSIHFTDFESLKKTILVIL